MTLFYRQKRDLKRSSRLERPSIDESPLKAPLVFFKSILHTEDHWAFRRLLEGLQKRKDKTFKYISIDRRNPYIDRRHFRELLGKKSSEREDI